MSCVSDWCNVMPRSSWVAERKGSLLGNIQSLLLCPGLTIRPALLSARLS